MPIPERGLLEEYTGEKNGVLFIGRWEDRKEPKEFLRVIKETKLKAKVMTAKNSVEKWRAELDAIGVEHDVRGGIIGEEKVEFIRSSKVFYMPSKSESYGFSLFEAAGHCHCVVGDYLWRTNWDPSLYNLTDKQSAAEFIKRLHDTPIHSNLAKVQDINAGIWKEWEGLFVERTALGSNTAKITKYDDFYLSQFIKELNRTPSSEDITSILNNLGRFKIIYTDKDTWFSKTGKLPETDRAVEEKQGNLFDW
jgi:glycosyltransferase involved in cell wall biosynthesis